MENLQNKPCQSEPHLQSELLLKDSAVARWLGLSPGTLRRMRMLGQGPVARKLGYSIRYRPADVEAWINAQPVLGRTVGVTQ